jgi:hypothetical protein
MRVGSPAFARCQERIEGVTPGPGYPAPTLPRDAAAGVQLYRANFSERMRRPRQRTTDVPTQVLVCERERYVSTALAEGLEPTASRLWRVRITAGHRLPRTHPEDDSNPYTAIRFADRPLVNAGGAVYSRMGTYGLRRLRPPCSSDREPRLNAH